MGNKKFEDFVSKLFTQELINFLDLHNLEDSELDSDYVDSFIFNYFENFDDISIDSTIAVNLALKYIEYRKNLKK